MFSGGRRDEGDRLRRADGRPRAVVAGGPAGASVRFEWPAGALRSFEVAIAPAGPDAAITLTIDGTALAGSPPGDASVLVDLDLALDPGAARFRLHGPGHWWEPERDRLNAAAPAPWAAGAAAALEAPGGLVLAAAPGAPLARVLRGDRSVLLRSLAWSRPATGKPRYRGDTAWDRLEATESGLRSFTWRLRFGVGPFEPAGASRFAAEAAAPLLARHVVPFLPPPGAPLAKGPTTAGPVRVEPEGVLLESLATAEPTAGGPPGRGEIELRVREATGRAGEARIRLPAKVLAARRVRLDGEEMEGRIEVDGESIRFPIGAEEVAAVRVKLEAEP